MNTKQNMTALVLTGIALMMGASAMATELPAQDGRMWAPTGDVIGLENHATVGVLSWDPHGNKAKYAEDWQQEDDILFSGLFGFYKTFESERKLVVRGFGESGRGTLASRLTLLTSKPNKCRVTIDYRNFNSFYDATSEMRAVSFGGLPVPPSLSDVPSMGWYKANLGFAYNLGKGFGVNLGFDQMTKEGTKGSLLRNDYGSAVPGLKTFDTTTNEFSMGVDYSGTKLDVGVEGAYRQTDGDRIVGEHYYTDDQTLFRMGMNATYRMGGTSLMAMGSSSKLEATNGEVLGAYVFTPNGESKSTNGRVAVITKLGSSTTARLTAGMGTWNTDFQTDIGTELNKVTTRERSSLDMGLLVTNSSLSKTRLRFDYRFRTTNLEDTVSDVDFGTQLEDQDRQSHRANLRAGVRIGRKTKLKARLGWQSMQVDQTNSGDDLFYAMGDRKQDRFSGRLAVQTRPSTKMRLDVGFQGHAQSFEREDLENVKTTNNATQGFMGLNYFVSDRITFVGTGSYGLEKYEIEDGPVADGGMGPLTYEGTTLRLAPGLIMQVTNSMELEAHYEMVNFEDPGDAADEGNQLNSDLTRVLLRAGYRIGDSMKVSATYRRHEFDENRWDDYIMDLYSLSVSGRF